jgi:glutathione synthase/RimK-type ligase-like ATP-grasp enzyme
VIGLVTYAKFPQLTDDDRPLLHELARVGVEARAVRWDDPAVDWPRYDALVLRSCWDYHLRPAEFSRWLDVLDSAGVPLWNPASLVRWNMHKRYLRDLERGGAVVPRTVWVDAREQRSLPAIMRAAGWSEAVVKPAVSASATHTWRVTVNDAHSVPFDTLRQQGDVLVQELIPEVATHGEWSVILIDGEVSHAAIKRPRAGDFRVQWEHGGSAEPAVPPAAVTDAAREITHQIPGPWLYARVDGVDTARGFVLMELECIEPHLFFEFRQESRAAFANALARRAV